MVIFLTLRQICGSIMSKLDDLDLQEAGISVRLDRKRILERIKELDGRRHGE